MPRVVHFEIQADDPERAANFYRNVFDWKIEKWKGPIDYWMIMTGEGVGIDGGLVKRPVDLKAKGNINAFVCTIDVSDVDEYLHVVQANKGTVERPKEAIPGVGWLAYLRDTEGNLFGIMKSDKNAK